MGWFTRKKKNITTPTKDKKETPDGFWKKTPKGQIVDIEELEKNCHVNPDDNHHFRIGSEEYFTILFDGKKYKELDAEMTAKDSLEFTDKKPYLERIEASQKKSGLKDAVRTAYGNLNENPIVIASMDFSFIGGSMGSVVGEKIARAIDYAIKKKCPFLMISKSGGARMMEAGFSLMQMVKTSAKLTQLSKHHLPYFSLLTDPTTGGVTASYAMLGDVNIAEPNALIGFAGPRVIQETIGKELPEGFQTSEFLLEHGFIDFIVDRRELKEKLSLLMKLFKS